MVDHCRHRLVRDKESYCFLTTNRSGDDGQKVLTFHGRDASLPVLCDRMLTNACPFRDPGDESKSKKILPCPYCHRGHKAGSNSKMLCEEWHSVKEVLKRMREEHPGGTKYYEGGTRELPYSIGTPELIRRLIWQKLKTAVLRRDRYTCQDCRTAFGARSRKVFRPQARKGRGCFVRESLEVHHIIPRSRGGSDHPANLKTLCPSCHRQYTNELISDRAAEVRETKRSMIGMDNDNETGQFYDDPRD